MGIIDILFPKQCIFCSRIGAEICSRCLINLPNALPSCAICERLSNNGEIHKNCLKINSRVIYKKGWNLTNTNSKVISSVQSFGLYQFLLRILINSKGTRTLVRESEIFPLHTMDIHKREINKNLKKTLSNLVKESIHSKICFVGLDCEEKELLRGQILEQNNKEILILTVF